MELRRMEDIYCDKFVVSVDQTEYGNALAVTYDDSSIVFHDPKNMTAFNGVEDTNTVTSLAQAGFYCPPDATGYCSCLHNEPSEANYLSLGIYTSFSPSCCAAVMLDSDGQIHLRLMEHSYGTSGDAYDESTYCPPFFI